MGFDNDFFGSMQDLDGLSVVHAEFASVSADGAELQAHQGLVPILQRVRQGLGVDVFFVAQFVNGAPIVRPAAASASDDPGEVCYAHMLLDDALRTSRPAQPRLHRLHSPVVSKEGRRFGTVACDARPPGGNARCNDATALESVARMIALVLSRSEAPDTTAVWDSSAAAPLGLH
jgi:hypothetical protein